jgi:acyl-CoA thioester hydrolase
MGINMKKSLRNNLIDTFKAFDSNKTPESSDVTKITDVTTNSDATTISEVTASDRILEAFNPTGTGIVTDTNLNIDTNANTNTTIKTPGIPDTPKTGEAEISNSMDSFSPSDIQNIILSLKSFEPENPSHNPEPSPSEALPLNQLHPTASSLDSDLMDEAISTNVITGDLLKPYTRQAMYYETDQMGVIHHSNYIRWFEESRTYFLEQIGLSYDKLEDDCILIPVLSVSCKYKSSVRFNEKVIILPKITNFNGFKMNIQYYILDAQTHTLKASGESEHCFVNKEFKPINIKKNFKEVYDILVSWIN